MFSDLSLLCLCGMIASTILLMIFLTIEIDIRSPNKDEYSPPLVEARLFYAIDKSHLYILPLMQLFA